MGKWRGGEAIRTVAVIGSGVIGSGWVAAFLASGRAVRVFDPSPQATGKVMAHVSRAWGEMAALGHLREGADPQAVTFHGEFTEVTEGADFVQENTPERAEIKRDLFGELDRLLPADVIVASSTSSLPITELASGCTRPERFVLGHPFNPVHLMPLVETGGGELTDPTAIDTAEAFYVSMGKVSVRLRREIFGHIANRLTSAMFREAVSLVAQGIATVADIDDAIRYGPALKWAIQGQFTTFHTSGGEGGLESFLRHFSPGIVRRWQTMSDPDLADRALQRELVRQMGAASNGRTVDEIAREQDAKLVELLRTLGSAN